MYPSRRGFLATVAGGVVTWGCSESDPYPGVTRYVRYKQDDAVKFGVLKGDTIAEIEGDLFGDRALSGNTVEAKNVKLLYPIEPSKVLSLAGNYKDHLDEDQAVPENPEVFYKTISSLQHPGDPIVMPPDSNGNLHFEAEFVIVIGKKAQRISLEEAPDHILGYTCGHDVSERDWQDGDMQWWRCKGADTFSPMGPVIATGLDFEKSTMRLRLNGEIKQEAALADLIHKPAETVSFISHYVTLLPGDVIFTGTPGQTSAMKVGDVAKVEIDGIGVLINPVIAG
ncbi:MAG: fumarylacetoacetate hydrolase [Solibacterales bacterium]|nr:fumarylacetoacetate hydrolase [Bryobacterales bacterium]|tara:strand:- start:5186 stop:6034 length:849 start_codon:yes stop_codon:yes gene_type:complete